VKNGTGSSKNHAIVLPERVNPASLSLILDYCRFHQVPGRSIKERKSFDEKFVRIDTEKLCKLASAALGLQLRPLVDLTCGALARIIGGKTPDEVRDIFHLPDDLTEVRVPFILSYRKRSFDLVDYNSPLWSSKTRHHHKSRGIKRGLSFETLTHAIFICQNLLSLRKRNWNR